MIALAICLGVAWMVFEIGVHTGRNRQAAERDVVVPRMLERARRDGFCEGIRQRMSLDADALWRRN